MAGSDHVGSAGGTVKEEKISAKSHAEIAKNYDHCFDSEVLHAISDPHAYTNRKQSLFLLNLLAVPFDLNKKLLDVACGGGGFLYYAEQRVSCCGVDISPVAIEYARKLLKRTRVEVGKAEVLAYNDREFDFVTCLGSLEHFLDMDRALQEMRRVLKENGKLLIYVPNLYFFGDIVWVWLTGKPIIERGRQPVERANTVNGWQQLIEDNGFRVIRVAGYNLRYPLLKIILRPSRIGLLRLVWHLASFLIPKNLSYHLAYVVEKSN